MCILLMGMTMETEAGEPKSAPAKLNEVTMFYRGAVLEHAATVALDKGDNEVWIEGLSSGIDEGSLRIGMSGGAIITAYEYVPKHQTEKAADAATQRMLDSLKAQENRLRQIGVETKVNAQMLKILETGMTQKMSTPSERGLSLDELARSMDYYKTKTIAIENDQARLQVEKATCEKILKRLRQQLAEAGHNAGALRLNVTAPTAGAVRVAVSYCTFAASWTPYYSINVEAPEKPIRIVQKAKVKQTTGLDWKHVKLTLSTGTPNNGRVAPLFNTWFLREQPPMVLAEMAVQNSYSKRAVMSKMKEADVADMAVEEEEATERSIDDHVIVNDNAAVTTTYAIDLPYDIPGNGKEQNIDLRTQEAAADYYYYAAPKLDTEAYLLAEIKESDKLDLPSGSAQITYDGIYLGETYIDNASTLKKLTLTLGTDKRITVKREKVKDFSSKKVFGSDTRQVFAYTISVKNNRKRDVRLTLKDQYPISTQKNIEVELLKDTTTPTTNNTETGVVTWNVTLKAGEARTFTFSYSVKYPKGMDLNL